MNYAGNGRPTPAPSSLTAQDMEYPGMSTLDAKDEYMSPALSFQHHTMLAQQSSPTPEMLTTFMSNQAAGPWSLPPHTFPDTGPDAMTLRPLTPAYYDYRSVASVSAASDSGYASLSRSLLKPYKDDTSLISEETFDPEVQRISSQFGLVAFDRSGPREAVMPATGSAAPETKPASKLQCEHCNEIVKTKSALKKHHQRHTKPHLCHEPGCSRHNDGFSTQNDLARHQRSVHKNLRYTSGKQYRCTLESCQDKFKIWPRGDNFRNHLQTVHRVPAESTSKRTYLDQFLYRPMYENGEDLLHGVTGGSTESELDPRGFPNTVASWDLGAYSHPGNPSATGDDHAMGDPDDLQLEHADDPMSAAVAALRGPAIPRQVQETIDCLSYGRPVLEVGRPEYRQAGSVLGSSHEPFQTEGFGETASIAPQLTYQNPAQVASGSGLAGRSSGSADPRGAFASYASVGPVSRKQPDTSDDTNAAPPGSSNLGNFSTARAGAKRKRPESAQIKDEPQREEKMIKMLDGIPTDLLARYLKEKGIRSSSEAGRDSDDSGAKSEQQSAQKHQCAQCKRSFSRNSELNKHMRRHEKPYGCTFPGCNRPFGSKSDWRRHESSQHSQLEMWKCDEPAGGGVCPKASQSRREFEWHLWSDHGVRDDAERRARLERCRVHRGSVGRFWCGFCREVVVVDSGPGKGAWGERYDHIGNHFTGSHGLEKGDITEWSFGDLGLGDEEMEEAEAEAGAGVRGKRKREGEEGWRGRRRWI